MEEVGTATVGGDSASEYEHWPDDETQLSAPSAVSGYDSLNGYHEFQYIPANQEKKQAEPPKVVQPVPQYYYQPAAPIQTPQAQAPAPFPQYFNPYSPYAYPAPAYYGFPATGAFGGAMPAMPYGQFPRGYTPVYVPAPARAPPAEKKGDKPKKPEIRKWQGRTKAEVEEDNMKIAKAEGACDARKVEPVGLKADQMVWVVEGDGSPTLR
jgi:hypothetical protein